jgi:hypothetical protein
MPEVTTPEVTPEVVAPVVEAAAPAAPADPDWLPARLERAKRAAEKDVLETIGVTSLDEAKTAIEDARKLRESQMTEADKAREEAEAATKRAEAAEAKVAERDMADKKRALLESKHLSPELADVLAGSDEESFAASVEKYVATNPPRSEGPPTQDGLPPSRPDDGLDIAEARRRAGLKD